jgi:hypothetical protein
VMEELLWRPLRRWENVRHKNGDRADNPPEDLEMWLRAHPPGQRLPDLVKWVVEQYPAAVEEQPRRGKD